jgi:hypothetical protein
MTDKEVQKVLIFAKHARNVQRKGRLYRFNVRVEMHGDISWLDYKYYDSPKEFITFMENNYRKVRKIERMYFNITVDRYQSFYYTGQKSTDDTYRYLMKVLKLL